MFEYKNQDFYNEFFEKNPNFNLKEPFKSNNEGLFVGLIEPKECIYSVDITVEIPIHFPHRKVNFYTNSLFGYPHLIALQGQKRSWFCLNAPFAETAEAQLTIELEKLCNWFKLMTNEKLPPRIENRKLIDALRFASAYSWEFLGHDGYSNDARLIFVGDFGNDSNRLPKNGYLYCKRVELDDISARFYAFEEKKKGLVKIPYIIVDNRCDNPNSFFDMASFYGWDDETCHRLLPALLPNLKYYEDEFIPLKGITRKMIDQLDKQVEETTIQPEHYDAFLRQIERIKHSDGNLLWAPFGNDFRTFRVGTTLSGDQLFQEIKRYFNREFYFALGIKGDEEISWNLFSTCREYKLIKPTNYKLGEIAINVNELLDISLVHHLGCINDYQHYFGRSGLDFSISDKNIAIIGVGAIGSRVLESLVRSGAKKISIWDGDKVEPGNICRSIYNLEDVGKNKAEAAAIKVDKLSPFVQITYSKKYLYGEHNYLSQAAIIEELKEFDIIFDCTASNELLHFLSYALPNKMILSICITNRAQDLLCMSSIDGNAFEMRKLCLSAIEQDTENYYVEGTGCYSPTFLASCSDVSFMVDMYLSWLNHTLNHGQMPHSIIFSNRKDGVVVNQVHNYVLPNTEITLHIFNETLLDTKNLPDLYNDAIGYFFGSYSEDRKQIFVSHAVPSAIALSSLDYAFETSGGVIDYIGEIHYSKGENNTYDDNLINLLAGKAQAESVCTNNPLLGIRNPDGSISFFLYSDGNLFKFEDEKI